ncbi:MAG: DUF3015 family protein [Bdellovibrionota bacterium]
MKSLLTIALVLMGTSAYAATAGIGPAGCGLGNVVFGKDNQVLAATTNGTSANQTFGITSGTLNCGPGGMAGMNMFIENNQVALENDAARGQGETVATLASMMGCQDVNAFGSTLKSNYSEIFTSKDAKVIGHSIRETVKKDERLARTCQHIG